QDAASSKRPPERPPDAEARGSPYLFPLPRARAEEAAFLFQYVPGDRADAEQAGAGVGADHRADLRGERRLAAEDLVAVFDQPVRGLLVLDVLDDPGVGPRLVALARVVAQPLDRARAGPHP